MEELPRHRRSCFKRSAMSFQIQSSTSSCSHSQPVDVPKPHSQDKPPKTKGFLSFLFGKKSQKVRKPNRREGYHTSLEERDVRKLIWLYQKHDNLYNPRNAYYGHKEIEEDCYNYMARCIRGKSSSELRSCIEELRHLFEREYWIIESTRRSRGEVLTPSIRYYNEFLFLVPHLCLDLTKSHGSDTSLPNPKCVVIPPPGSKKLTQFTGFPLVSSPGKMSCAPRMMRRKSQKEDIEKIRILKQMHEPKEESVTFPSLKEQRPIDGPAFRKSKVSISSSMYSNEQVLKTTDLTVSRDITSNSEQQQQQSMKLDSKAFEEHKSMTSNSEQKQQQQQSMKPDSEVDVAFEEYKSMSSAAESSQKGSSSFRQDNMTLAAESSQKGSSSFRQDNMPAPPEEKKDAYSVAMTRNDQQVQMLCDMIRTELTAAPDIIYFDAKWRIIEILREVHKRQLVTMKTTLEQNSRRQQLSQIMKQHHPYKPSREPSPLVPARAGLKRICDHIKGSQCPYCCHGSNS